MFLEGAKEHILDSSEALGYSPEFLDDLKTGFRRLLANDKLKHLPLKFIGEVQYLHKDYLEMRLKSHLYYKKSTELTLNLSLMATLYSLISISTSRP